MARSWLTIRSDVDLPKRSSEVGVIRRMFLDPTASHLLITTALAENFYLHTQSRQPRPLARLKGVAIESVAWNLSRPTASTREILVGASDGTVYEVYIEPSTEFFRREEKYLKTVYKISDGPVTGLWVGLSPGAPNHRRILLSSHRTLSHLVGRLDRPGHDRGAPSFANIFEAETPVVYDLPRSSGSTPSALVLSPDEQDVNLSENASPERVFAWLSSQGIFHGPLQPVGGDSDLGNQVFSESRLFSRSQIPASATLSGRRKADQYPSEPISAIALSRWHILILVEGRVVAVNRLNEQIVYDQSVVEIGQTVVGLVADQKKGTLWLITAQEIFEIVVNNEDQDVWRIMLKRGEFDAALNYARTPGQKDAVATAYGDSLVSRSRYMDAAGVYGRSSKPLEQVALAFIDHQEQDALRKYLLAKLSAFKKSLIMQRIMVASWLVEIFMSKLDGLDDTIATNAEVSENTTTGASKEEMSAVRTEFQEFVSKYKADLDQKTTYDIISSHGREEELLYYAMVVQDYNFVLGYWIQRERWSESLATLKKQTDPDTFYKYSSVLMSHVPNELVDVLMRQSNIEPKKLIPALLNYDDASDVPLAQVRRGNDVRACIDLTGKG